MPDPNIPDSDERRKSEPPDDDEVAGSRDVEYLKSRLADGTLVFRRYFRGDVVNEMLANDMPRPTAWRDMDSAPQSKRVLVQLGKGDVVIGILAEFTTGEPPEWLQSGHPNVILSPLYWQPLPEPRPPDMRWKTVDGKE